MPQAQQGGGSAQPSGQLRGTRSGCTPDSYGYCVVHVRTTVSDKITCGGLFHYQVTASVYELYYNNVDQGTYTLNGTNYGCPGDPTSSWDPEEPSVATGDPNLP